MADYEFNGDQAREQSRLRKEMLDWGLSRTDRLRRWLIDHCNVDGMENWFFGTFPKEGASVRGMGATRHILAGEFVTCVPKSCWLTHKDYSAEVAQMTTAEIRICDDSSKLAIYIAQEMHASDSSKFGPYFDATPTTEEMQGYHPAYNSWPFRREYDMWGYINKALRACYIEYALNAGPEAVPFETVRLASIMLSSRAFHITGLPPPMDFVNTDKVDRLTVMTSEINASGHPIHDNDPASQANASHFCFVAMRDISPGEELTCPYGSEHKDVFTNFNLYAFTFEDETVHASSNMGLFSSDYCAGMYPHQFHFPGHDASGPLLNYWRFAKKHCHDLMWGGSVPELSWGVWLLAALLSLASGMRKREKGVQRKRATLSHGGRNFSGAAEEKKEQMAGLAAETSSKRDGCLSSMLT